MRTSQVAAGIPGGNLKDFGPAPEFAGIQSWLDTPDGKPLTIAGLRGRVVLIDFWTYSCINCLRTLPQVTAWDAKYRDAGLTIVGVHSPEFAFEHVVAEHPRGRSPATTSATRSRSTTTSRPGRPGGTSTGRRST